MHPSLDAFDFLYPSVAQIGEALDEPDSRFATINFVERPYLCDFLRLVIGNIAGPDLPVAIYLAHRTCIVIRHRTSLLVPVELDPPFFTGSSLCHAQSNEAPLSVSESAPLTVQARDQNAPVLPANTEVLLRTNQEITTKGNTWSEGDTFALSVVHDVMLDDYVVIPAGSRATGRITWMTNKGMFGKSGKMDIEIDYVTVGGRRIDLDGTYRQEGEGNTVATVAGVVLVPLTGLFITGRSGRIPQGRELVATTENDIVLSVPPKPATVTTEEVSPAE